MAYIILMNDTLEFTTRKVFKNLKDAKDVLFKIYEAYRIYEENLITDDSGNLFWENEEHTEFTYGSRFYEIVKLEVVK